MNRDKLVNELAPGESAWISSASVSKLDDGEFLGVESYANAYTNQDRYTTVLVTKRDDGRVDLVVPATVQLESLTTDYHPSWHYISVATVRQKRFWTRPVLIASYAPRPSAPKRSDIGRGGLG